MSKRDKGLGQRKKKEDHRRNTKFNLKSLPTSMFLLQMLLPTSEDKYALWCLVEHSSLRLLGEINPVKLVDGV